MTVEIRGYGGVERGVRVRRRGATVGRTYRVIDREQRAPLELGLGGVLRWLRINRFDVSISELARRIGIDHSMLSRLEAGDRVPSRELAITIADTLGIEGAERIAILSLAGVCEQAITYELADVVLAVRTLAAMDGGRS